MSKQADDAPQAGTVGAGFDMPTTAAAQPFLDMAARIQRNADSDFAGAAVIVPPEGDPIVVMTMDPKKDGLSFWGTLKARVEMEGQEFLDRATRKEQENRRFGR
jgi:hypothetical protein